MIFPRDVLDAAGLDAEMRAIAERATSGAEQRDAQPSVGLDPMEADATDIPQTDASDIWMDPMPEVPAGGGGGGEVESDGVSINKVPESSPGATPNGDEGKLQLRNFKSATGTELQLGTTATTDLFPVKSNGQIEYRKLKIPAAGGGITVGTDKIVLIRFEWVGEDHQDFASHPYTFKVVRGELDITNNELTVVEKPNLAQYLPTTPLSQEANAS